ncbi:hypothetical protein NFJ01_10570 [Lelliottia amnigena]|uniref:hypothetical protein n=1 Tax=Lelliottia amnigena TaxID=61646 RepID=UPI002090F199|nr:hypothetical protein [Lelliottia amnigena]USR62775.1 hypothetical protein NFJ01_10570 [Lelliottia amnigena]
MRKFWNMIISSTSMAILAFLGIAFAIYQTYFYERSGRLLIESIPPSKILDVRQPVGGLDITFDGKNLRENKQTLWLVNLKITNAGNAGIVKSDFDEKDPVGIVINDGEIADITAISSPDPYVSKTLEIKREKAKIIFPPIILDEGVYFSLNLLVLGDELNPPKLQAEGKVAGMRTVSINNIFSDEDTMSFSSVWSSIFKAEYWWVQIPRVIIYFFIAAFSMGIIVMTVMGVTTPFDKIKERRSKAERRRFLSTYKQDESISRTRRILSIIYEEDAKNGLLRTNEAMVVALARNELYQKLNGNIDELEIKQVIKSRYPLRYYLKEHYKYLIQKQLITFKQGSACPEISPDLKSELFDLMDSLGVEKITNADDITQKYSERAHFSDLIV